MSWYDILQIALGAFASYMLLNGVDRFHMRRKLKNRCTENCECDARFSGSDDKEYSARGCPSCTCGKGLV